jgi:hypothetical protein
MNNTQIIVPLIILIIAGIVIFRFVARLFIKLILFLILGGMAVYMFLQA